MNKTLNIILFWPGHAGHFIQFLLSLDNKTYPIYNPKVEIDTIPPRKNLYSFKNAVWKNGGWGNFHASFMINKSHVVTEAVRIQKFIESETHDTYTAIASPKNLNELLDKIETDFLSSVDQVNYLNVELSPNLEYVIEDFKRNNHSFPTPADLPPFPEMITVFNNYKSEHNPYSISLDNFFYGQDTFLTEYTNLNNHLGLPLHTADALELYIDWYNERKIARSNVVKP